MLQEFDRAALTVDLPDHNLRQGDIGTVILIHREGQGYEVEFVALDGEAVAVISLLATQLRPIGRREFAQARVMA